MYLSDKDGYWPFRRPKCGRDLRNWGAANEEKELFGHEPRAEHISACSDDFSLSCHPKLYAYEAKKKVLAKARHAERKYKRHQ